MVRLPAVAGAFYPAERAELARQIDEFCAGSGVQAKARAIACIVPHAGYMYSGHVAGVVYAELDIPERCILLGPRHFPQGQPLAILTEGAWRTPLGDAEIDAQLAADLVHAFPLLREDGVAHAREHSLEVQIPFLHRLAQQNARSFRFAPVVLASDRYPVLEELGRAVAQTIAKANASQSGPVLIVASTDMNHYESDAVTRAKDARAIECILALDARGLYDTVRNEGITMCGYAATVTTIVAARELGAAEARLVRYATSGDVNGDFSRVVGYVGVIIG
ncbi:MAG TPA: AmmeMemoRadiSam system protein B [Candidatus Acidoferrales bacterium]|nr:AmmeMemoRadiSam system protein B [Candidatus Acidoferrales bacterium]